MEIEIYVGKPPLAGKGRALNSGGVRAVFFGFFSK